MSLVNVFMLIFLMVACSRGPVRKLASHESDFSYGSIDPQESLVKAFPPEVDSGKYHYYLYLELNDLSRKPMDIYSNEISFVSRKKINLPFTLKRMSRGIYYLGLEVTEKDGSDEITLFIQNKEFKEFRPTLNQPDFSRSSLHIIQKDRHSLRMRLFLSDSKGVAINASIPPDLIIEGEAIAENLEQTGEGLWEFDIRFNDENQIIYVSVRSQGTFLKHLFRHLHIEK